MTKKTICNKALLLSALFAAVLQAQEADVIFVGDNILTMDDAGAEAIAIQGEIIIAAGDRAEVMATRGGIPASLSWARRHCFRVLSTRTVIFQRCHDTGIC